jgi:hypothetical protein
MVLNLVLRYRKSFVCSLAYSMISRNRNSSADPVIAIFLRPVHLGEDVEVFWL